MNELNSGNPPEIVEVLHRTGYASLRQFNCEQSTLEVGRSLGNIVSVESLLPRSGIPTVQSLTPKHAAEAASNQYSGSYGLGEFPLHTDLAHWARPPRYLILRCRTGSSEVVTRLLSWHPVISSMADADIQRAIFRPRHMPENRTYCLLRFPIAGQRAEFGYRWDELFLVPMNSAAEAIAKIMRNKAFDVTSTANIILTNPGDTLIVDNWLTLHGRSPVSESDSRRHIERAYLSRLFE